MKIGFTQKGHDLMDCKMLHPQQECANCCISFNLSEGRNKHISTVLQHKPKKKALNQMKVRLGKINTQSKMNKQGAQKGMCPLVCTLRVNQDMDIIQIHNNTKTLALTKKQ